MPRSFVSNSDELEHSSSDSEEDVGARTLTRQSTWASYRCLGLQTSWTHLKDTEESTTAKIERTVEALLEKDKPMDLNDVDIDLLSEEVLLQAAQTGSLLTLLKQRNTALDKFPSIALGYLAEAEHELNRCKELEAMYLIANFVQVPTISVERMLQSVTQQMLVFKPPPKSPEDKHLPESKSESEYKWDVAKIPGKSNFPKELGAFYIKRMFQWDRKEMEFVERTRTLEIRDLSCGTDIQLVFATLNINLVTFEAATKRSLSIPVHAEFFTFVCPIDAFPVGGFLYLDKSKKPIAVNWLTLEPQGFAMCFKQKSITMIPQAAEFIRMDKRWIPITVDFLAAAGAVHYSFIGPDDTLRGSFAGDPRGGFAYHIQKKGEPTQYVFFGIEACGELIVRGRFIHGQEIVAAEMEQCPQGRSFFHALTKSPWRTEMSVEKCEISLARLEFPGALDPLMLHSLSNTPQNKVLETQAAKAIASASFIEWSRLFNITIVANLVAIVALTRMTYKMRTRLQQGADPWLAAPGLWATDDMLCIGVISCNFLFNLVQECLLWYSLKKRSWLWGYLQTGYARFKVVGLLIAALLVIITFQSKCQIDGNSFDCLLLATLGCIYWLQVLWSLRSLDRFGLGRKVLPILEALHDVISFLIVSMFFAATSMQVSYALTVSKVSTIFFNTYRMSFVGEMNSELFFGEEGPDWSLQGLFHFWWYFFFSFLVMVSLANIFIQVMGNAYDEAGKRVGVSFVRSRVTVSLYYTLMAEALTDLFATRYVWLVYDATRYVWLAYPQKHESATEAPAEK